MKKWVALFTILFACKLQAELVRFLPSGTVFTLRHDIPLSEGQRALLIGNKKCRIHLNFMTPPTRYLPSETQLIIEKVTLKPAEEGISPYSGHFYRTIPEIRIDFKENSLYMECIGNEAWDMDTSELELDDLLQIQPPG